MIMLRQVVFTILILFTHFQLSAATVLSPGDIAIVTLNCDAPDAFDFVCFKDLDSGSEIHFTDMGWDGYIPLVSSKGDEIVMSQTLPSEVFDFLLVETRTNQELKRDVKFLQK